MRKTVIATAALALVMAMVGASSASAYKFSPEGLSVTGIVSGATPFEDDQGDHWSCGSHSWEGKVSSGKILSSGPLFGSCSSSVWSGPWYFKRAGSWQIRATGLATAEVTADTVPSGGPVLKFENPSAGCTSTVKGPVTLHNVGWEIGRAHV